MKRISRKEVMKYLFSHDLTPEITVEPREEFTIETEDALSGRIRTKDDLPTPALMGDLWERKPRLSNPLSGPVFVKGAERGDVLVVRVIDVIPAEQGFTCFAPRMGPLGDSVNWTECRGPYTHIIKHIPGPSGTTSDGKGIFSPKIIWDLKPFIGSIGVAPDVEIETSAVGQGPWGGNMDCRDVCKGSRVYLPVYHKGGLLFVGDVHATQADSEFYGVADETRAEVTLSCDVIKNKTIPWVRIEKANSIIQLNSYRPLEHAITQAFLWLMDWLVTEHKVEKKEAYMHMSVNPDVRINVYQMVPLDRIQYTVGVEFPKKYLV